MNVEGKERMKNTIRLTTGKLIVIHAGITLVFLVAASPLTVFTGLVCYAVNQKVSGERNDKRTFDFCLGGIVVMLAMMLVKVCKQENFAKKQSEEHSWGGKISPGKSDKLSDFSSHHKEAIYFQRSK